MIKTIKLSKYKIAHIKIYDHFDFEILILSIALNVEPSAATILEINAGSSSLFA